MQHRVHRAKEALPALIDRLRKSLQPALQLLRQQLRKADHGRERRAQLMAHVRQQGGLETAGRLGLVLCLSQLLLSSSPLGDIGHHEDDAPVVEQGEREVLRKCRSVLSHAHRLPPPPPLCPQLRHYLVLKTRPLLLSVAHAPGRSLEHLRVLVPVDGRVGLVHVLVDPLLVQNPDAVGRHIHRIGAAPERPLAPLLLRNIGVDDVGLSACLPCPTEHAELKVAHPLPRDPPHLRLHVLPLCHPPPDPPASPPLVRRVRQHHRL